MHNNIMAAGSKERPPMLGPGRYSQWHSRFLRYLDTKSNGDYLRKCIFDATQMRTLSWSINFENPSLTLRMAQSDKLVCMRSHYDNFGSCNRFCTDGVDTSDSEKEE
ncbi:hypothetical protein Tco_0890864 [Tanacetum coccineum]|uniref:Uncharacterized protein n=1 Tax=Tanacetum coccineum TaxID=301880 RepID=A0ABQ5C499_9ASTR